MTIIDTFTRKVELYPSPAATGKSAAQHLLQHFGRFEAPTQLLSDRRSHFVNEVIEKFTSLVGTEHCLTLSYSSQQNSIIERVWPNTVPSRTLPYQFHPRSSIHVDLQLDDTCS
jgi:transposase InsO family protein